MSLLYNKEKDSIAFFDANVNKSVYFFVYGSRLTFAVFMDGDLSNSFSAASFIVEQTIILHSLNYTFVTSPEIFDFHCGATMTLQDRT